MDMKYVIYIQFKPLTEDRGRWSIYSKHLVCKFLQRDHSKTITMLKWFLLTIYLLFHLLQFDMFTSCSSFSCKCTTIGLTSVDLLRPISCLGLAFLGIGEGFVLAQGMCGQVSVRRTCLESDNFSCWKSRFPRCGDPPLLLVLGLVYHLMLLILNIFLLKMIILLILINGISLNFLLRKFTLPLDLNPHLKLNIPLKLLNKLLLFPVIMKNINYSAKVC